MTFAFKQIKNTKQLSAKSRNTFTLMNNIESAKLFSANSRTRAARHAPLEIVPDAQHAPRATLH